MNFAIDVKFNFEKPGNLIGVIPAHLIPEFQISFLFFLI